MANLPLKRGGRANALDTKRARLHADLESLAAAEESEQRDRDVLAIVRKLQADPDKIRAVLLYLDTGKFQETVEESADFHKTLIYYNRIPKKFWEQLLPTIWPNLSNLKRVCGKRETDVARHVVFWIAGLDPKDKLPSVNKEDIKKIVLARAKHFHRDPSALKIVDGVIDWALHGWYTLVQEAAGSSDLNPTGYVTCAGYEHKKPLPPYIQCSQEFTIVDNWNIHGAQLRSLAGQKPVFSMRLYSLFEADQDFRSFAMRGSAVEPFGKLAGDAVGTAAAEVEKAVGVPADHVQQAAEKQPEDQPRLWQAPDRLSAKLAALKR